MTRFAARVAQMTLTLERFGSGKIGGRGVSQNSQIELICQWVVGASFGWLERVPNRHDREIAPERHVAASRAAPTLEIGLGAVLELVESKRALIPE